VASVSPSLSLEFEKTAGVSITSKSYGSTTNIVTLRLTPGTDKGKECDDRIRGDFESGPRIDADNN
jgi:hypothetical protein